MFSTFTKVRTLAIVFPLLIIAGSSVPSQNIPTVFSFTPDKLIHCVEYAILACIIFIWMRQRFNSLSLMQTQTLTFLACSLFGALDENYQRLIPGRMPDFWDWVMDSAGVLLAVILMGTFTKVSK